MEYETQTKHAHVDSFRKYRIRITAKTKFEWRRNHEILDSQFTCNMGACMCTLRLRCMMYSQHSTIPYESHCIRTTHSTCCTRTYTYIRTKICSIYRTINRIERHSIILHTANTVEYTTCYTHSRAYSNFFFLLLLFFFFSSSYTGTTYGVRIDIYYMVDTRYT